MSMVRSFLVGASFARVVLRKSFAAFAVIACLAGAAQAHEASERAPQPIAQTSTTQQDRYAPYAFLIGDWDTNVALARPFAIVQSYHWGPGRTFIEASAAVRTLGQPDDLHFSGIMTWNQARQSLDFLFMHEPGTGGQEAGIVHAEPDGTVVRDITETTGQGAVRHGRQTFRRMSDGRVITSMTHQNPDGSWAPNFPGADNLVMVRRPD